MKKGQTTAVAAIVRAMIDKIEWAKIDRGETDGNSRSIRRQRLGGGGKPGILT
jgi:hypothetical protein